MRGQDRRKLLIGQGNKMGDRSCTSTLATGLAALRLHCPDSALQNATPSERIYEQSGTSACGNGGAGRAGEGTRLGLPPSQCLTCFRSRCVALCALPFQWVCASASLDAHRLRKSAPLQLLKVAQRRYCLERRSPQKRREKEGEKRHRQMRNFSASVLKCHPTESPNRPSPVFRTCSFPQQEARDVISLSASFFPLKSLHAPLACCWISVPLAARRRDR